MKYFTSIFITLILIFNIVQAHDSGTSFEKEVKDFLLEIGAEQKTIKAGEQTDFDFALFKNGVTYAFEDVFVEFIKGEKIIFSSRLANPKIGRATMKIIFPEGGTYNMKVLFLDNEKKIVGTVYEFEVAARDNKEMASEINFIQNAISGIAGLIIGLVVISLIKRRNN